MTGKTKVVKGEHNAKAVGNPKAIAVESSNGLETPEGAFEPPKSHLFGTRQIHGPINAGHKGLVILNAGGTYTNEREPRVDLDSRRVRDLSKRVGLSQDAVLRLAH